MHLLCPNTCFVCIFERSSGMETNLCPHANELPYWHFHIYSCFACLCFLSTDRAHLCQMLLCISTGTHTLVFSLSWCLNMCLALLNEKNMIHPLLSVLLCGFVRASAHPYNLSNPSHLCLPLVYREFKECGLGPGSLLHTHSYPHHLSEPGLMKTIWSGPLLPWGMDRANKGAERRTRPFWKTLVECFQERTV